MRQTARVSRVIDGDTFEIPGDTIRLENVNCPEMGQSGGSAARQKLESLIGGKTVSYEGQARDTYGRLVAQVWVNGINVNAEMRRFCS